MIVTDLCTGKAGEDNTASGTITIPEVAHDTEEDEFVVCFPTTSQTAGSGLPNTLRSLR